MSDALKVETTYIPHLRTQFASGSLVLFTGAGFSLDGINTSGEKLPSALELTKILWNMCFPGEEFEADTQLQDIFQAAQSQHGKELARVLKQKFTVDGSRSSPWYKDVLSMPWLRVYTLNIDNLIEKVFEDIGTAREVNSISAITDTPAKFSDTKFDVIHLNGVIEDAPEHVTFSRSQYAERVDNDPFYQQLNSDLLARPVIFIGTSLEEGPMWDHLVARGSKGTRTSSELRPRSYLVLPHLNKSKQSMLSRFNITWLPMTGESFCKEILSKLDDARSDGFKALKNRGLVGNTRNSNVNIVSDLLQITTSKTEYLLGEEPTWPDIQNEKCAIRECFSNLWDDINSVRAQPTQNELIIITGTAGVGKSTALMWAALKLQADGVVVGWLDSNNKLTQRDILNSLSNNDEIGALLINDADIYGSQLSSIVGTVNKRYPKLLVMIEARSSKVDNLIKPYELGLVRPKEITVPNLCDSDIDKIIAVLDKENRLGRLKGLSDDQRKIEFNAKAGRQLLVAMYEATSGKKFAERAEDELSELQGQSKVVYGLISTASAYRYSLSRDEILIACGESTNLTLNAIDTLVRRKLIHTVSIKNELFKARHRVIADINYNFLIRNGQFVPIIKGLLQIGVAKVSKNSDRNSRPSRLLRTFINHNFMKRTVELEDARNIYGDFEYALSWDSHYWLHRGALELESDNLDVAENFLNQAMSLRPDDLFVQNEWAYLLFKKAIANPTDISSNDTVDEAIKLLNAIIVRRQATSAHAYHVLGAQGLDWAKVGIIIDSERLEFLYFLKKKIKEAVSIHTRDEFLSELYGDIERAILGFAVRP